MTRSGMAFKDVVAKSWCWYFDLTIIGQVNFRPTGPAPNPNIYPMDLIALPDLRLRTCTRLEGPRPNRFCAMPIWDLVWLFENSASPFGTLLATNHHLHQVGTSIMFWPVTQKLLNGLSILTKNENKMFQVSIGTLIVPRMPCTKNISKVEFEKWQFNR